MREDHPRNMLDEQTIVAMRTSLALSGYTMTDEAFEQMLGESVWQKDEGSNGTFEWRLSVRLPPNIETVVMTITVT